MKTTLWFGGVSLIAVGTLAVYMAAAGAKSGDAIYIKRLEPVVLSAEQKNLLGAAVRAVWPAVPLASVVSLDCMQQPTVEGNTVDFNGNWECTLCETYVASAAEKLHAALNRTAVTTGKKCTNKVSVASGTLSKTQASNLEAFARGLANASSGAIMGSVYIARAPSVPGRVTAELGELVTTSPDLWDAASQLGDQPGGVVRLWGQVQ